VLRWLFGYAECRDRSLSVDVHLNEDRFRRKPNFGAAARSAFLAHHGVNTTIPELLDLTDGLGPITSFSAIAHETQLPTQPALVEWIVGRVLTSPRTIAPISSDHANGTLPAAGLPGQSSVLCLPRRLDRGTLVSWQAWFPRK
jgi:hypothetical protein